MIHIINNRNLLLTNNIKIIAIVEEQKNILTEMIMLGTKWKHMEIFIVEYLHLTKKILIIPLGNNSYAG